SRTHKGGRQACGPSLFPRGHADGGDPDSCAPHSGGDTGRGRHAMTRIAAAVVIVLVLAQASFAADIKPVRIVTPNNMIVLIVDQPSLPIVTVNVLVKAGAVHDPDALAGLAYMTAGMLDEGDRKSTRLNSSHVAISYAVFCLKKKKNK